jgi:hypothetical protein
MVRTFMNPEDGEELRRLYDELPKAHEWAVAAFRTDPPGRILEGEFLARFLAAEERVAAIVDRIKEIQGAE